MKTIAIKIPENLFDKIQRVADKRNETKSAVMREALVEFLAKNDNQNADSCLALAGDLAGCVHGPPDLATNPKHLDDYGK
ncbi:ribbon-helix-helix domain-containing protein [Desulfoferrobacter suflitae]|uniref:ribbon-helix-helix domain-containing protein n=1 Tax=Desulfoferrobacter suflitae TaxID=2865782 RepID=UPI0021640691|nr:ribbon-helix-helix domain-containing protein [Desulfoferrobacter suflitae]MCK8600509.1 ribbon-helix-helix domain-containing protein [Desulfoferrobacter suflitae]